MPPPKRVFLATVDLVATLYLSDVTIMLPPHTRWPLSLSPPQGALIAKLHHQKWAGQYLKSFWLSLTNRQILRWPSEKESLISLSSVKTGCNSRFWWISPPMFAETCLQQPGTYFVLQPLSEAHRTRLTKYQPMVRWAGLSRQGILFPHPTPHTGPQHCNMINAIQSNFEQQLNEQRENVHGKTIVNVQAPTQSRP